MKIRADITPEPLPKALQDQLAIYRAARQFDPANYLQTKTRLVNDYFTAYGLDTAVVGISGGIDSAVVLGILDAAEAVKTIVPVLMPATNHRGVTGQERATSRGQEVCEAFGVTPARIDITEAVNTIDQAVATGLREVLPVDRSDWGTGQLVSYARTPFFYYLATMLTDNGHNAVVIGTTNYTEGSYLGFIGKASDAMMDLQLISDLYKSEVTALAVHLEVPDSVVNATPRGDVFDGSTDEQIFGATYDFVELFLEYLNERARNRKFALTWSLKLSEDDRDYFTRHATSLKKLHSANKHKYLAGSPAVHLDVREFALNTWKINTWKKGS